MPYGENPNTGAVAAGAGAVGAGVMSLIGAGIGGYAGARLSRNSQPFGAFNGCGCGTCNSCCGGSHFNGFNNHYSGYYGGDWRFDRLERDVLINRVEVSKDAIINRNDTCCCIEKETDKILRSLNQKEIRDLELRNDDLKDRINKLELEKYVDGKFNQVYSENRDLRCQLSEVGRTAEAAVRIGRDLHEDLIQETLKPCSVPVSCCNPCDEKSFKNDMSSAIQQILRDVDRLNKDYDNRHHWKPPSPPSPPSP